MRPETNGGREVANPLGPALAQSSGDGGGVSSFIHLDATAAATVLALEHDGPTIYNVVDNEPAR